jgi:hypothetical protein
VGLGLAASVGLALHFLSDIDSPTFLIACSAIAGFALAVFYTLRYMRRAPRLIRSTLEGLTVVRRDAEESLAWNDVTAASHEAKRGLRWRFETSGGGLEIRDDGLSTTQWDELSKSMTAQLEARGIEVETGGWADLFADDDDDDDEEDEERESP